MSRPISNHWSALVIIAAFQSASAGDDTPTRTVTAEDMPRIPMTPADRALQTFRLAGGFHVELVAAEPLVGDPVDACFDARGRLFVAEMHGYPFSQEPTQLNPKGGGLKDGGIIRLLEDTTGDGRFDRSVVFADKMSWPTSICCYDGGVFVLAPQYLYYFKDTNGDDRADVRRIVLSGFGRNNVQAVTNGLKWGLDNRIYFAAGRNPKSLKQGEEDLATVGGTDLRFNPKTDDFETVTGGLQFGHSMDDWGTRFVCSNSNHIQQVVFPLEYLQRNPFFVAPGMIRSIAADGASARVFRVSPPEPWRIVRQKWRALAKGYKLVINDDGAWEFIPLDPTKTVAGIPTEYPVGFFTSATGVTIYRGNAYPARYRGNAFIGDVGGNLVHRKTVDRRGVVYRAQRADEGVELLASTDNWFRPVNFVNAPDGTLYILDMYRETIEHPYSIPEEIKAFLDLTSGREHGRIYRLMSPDTRRNPPIDLTQLDRAQLVQQLASDNAWHRETAQRLLWERSDQAAIPLVVKLLNTSTKPLARLHALHTLDGLGALSEDVILSRLNDPHPRVRAHVVRLAEPWLTKSTEVADKVAALATNENEHLRFQVALSLGETRSKAAVAGLTRILLDRRTTPEIRAAALSSVRHTAGEITNRLLEHTDSSAVTATIQQLGLIIGANSDTQQAVDLIKTVTAGEGSFALKRTVVASLGRGLARRGSSLTTILDATSTPQNVRSAAIRLFSAAAELANDDEADLKKRTAAIELLAFAREAKAREQLPKLLSSRTPNVLQAAAVRSLSAQPAQGVADLLLEGWAHYVPSTRREVIDAVLSRPTRIGALLDAVETGKIKRGDIDRDKKQTLMSHRNATIKQRSVRLFGSDVQTNRSKVVAQYQDVLQLEGTPQAGAVVFKKICSACHRAGTVGHAIAPDLTSVKNKSESDLLISILDPNREAQPNFNTYTVVTEQGLNLNGIIAAETEASLTLLRAESKRDVVFRKTIEELIANGVSLMPEGLEKDLSRQQIADVIAFIKMLPAPTKK